jgi:hypothetical protein
VGLIDRFKKKLSDGRWEVIRTIWPYKEGWGVVNKTTRTISDTGLPTKEAAQKIADSMNAGA